MRIALLALAAMATIAVTTPEADAMPAATLPTTLATIVTAAPDQLSQGAASVETVQYRYRRHYRRRYYHRRYRRY